MSILNILFSKKLSVSSVITMLFLAYSSTAFAGNCASAGLYAGAEPEGNKYVALNKGARFKVDYVGYPAPGTVTFRTSEDGIVGADDFHFNSGKFTAKYTVLFNNSASRGPSYVSATYDGSEHCRDVWVQNQPTSSITVNSLTYSTGYNGGPYVAGTLTFAGAIDTAYSKYGREGRQGDIEIYEKTLSQWTGSFCDVVEESSSWEYAGSVSASSTSYSFGHYCEAQYRVRVFDGIHHSYWDIKTIRAN